MGESVHPSIGKEGDRNEKDYETDSAQKRENVRKLEKFEEEVERRKAQQGDASCDSVAHTTMLNGGKMVDEVWEGDPEAEKANIVQEELYVHGKVCIVDDRVVICGSANINDRVGWMTDSDRVTFADFRYSPSSARTIARSPSSWKTKSSSTVKLTVNPTGQLDTPRLSAGSSGASIWAFYPHRNTTHQATRTRNHQTSVRTRS
jgi:hypothetical protein